MKNSSLALTWLLALALQFCSFAHASVVINGTRVIYPSGQREVSIRLTNDGQLPALVQAWVDTGDAKQLPEHSDAPFLLTPPVTRVDPGKGQSLRLMASAANGSSDAESVYWLNVLEIPPIPSASQKASNALQMAFRTRIKIFYRPEGLSEKDATIAPSQLQWRAVRDGAGWALECSNPTLYHVSLNSISLTGTPFGNREGGMVSPRSTLRIPIAGLEQPPVPGTRIEFESINDYGSVVPSKTTL